MYTVASGMVAVVVKVATVLFSGCNSSCCRLQYTLESAPQEEHNGANFSSVARIIM